MRTSIWLLALGLLAVARPAEAACSCYQVIDKVLNTTTYKLELVLTPTACNATPIGYGWIQLSNPSHPLWLAFPNNGYSLTACDSLSYAGERNGMPLVEDLVCSCLPCPATQLDFAPPDSTRYVCGSSQSFVEDGEGDTCSMARAEAVSAAQSQASMSCTYGVCAGSTSSKVLSCSALGPRRTDGFEASVQYTYACNVQTNYCQ